MFLALMLACQVPFGADRHDLTGFRIAAMSVPPSAGGDPVVPTVAVLVDGATWAPTPAELSWTWVATADDLAALDASHVPDATGPEPELVVPEDTRRVLGLIARSGGEERRAFVTLAEPPATLDRPTAFVLEGLPLALDTVTAPELALDARRALATTSENSVSPGGFARLTALFPPGQDPLVRWMATAGTFFELERNTADWAAGGIQIDDDEVVANPTALPEGAVVTVLALALGAPGEATFRALDLPIGETGPGLWVEGRWLPTDVAVPFLPGDAVTGTLLADDDSPVGLVLTAPVAAPAAAIASWGTEALDCGAPRLGPFDPNWLLTQVCGRDALIGAKVSVVPEGP